MPIQADLLASSHLGLAPLAGAPRNFAEFAAMAGNAVEIVIERAALHRPAALLGMLTPVASQLFRPGAAIFVRAGDRLEGATDQRVRLLVGRGFAASLEAPVPLGRPGLEIAAVDGKRLLEIKPSDPLAVLQLARHGDEPVIWLAASGGALPDWRPQRLDRETVLIGGSGGTRLGFNAETDRAITVDHAAFGGWRARL